MVDKAALRNAHRRAADVGRRAADNAGARQTTVTVIREQYSGPIGAPGVFQGYSPILVLSPSPKVVDGATSTGYFGGGWGSLSGTKLQAGQYLIGPITLTYPGGGYSMDQLVPAADVTSRVIYVLEGPGFKVGGEKFALLEWESTRPHQISLVVERTAQD